MAKQNYSYKDFVRSAQEAGLWESFSEADLRLAQASPEAGMSILSYKKDYAQARTEEARALANAGAERIRASYGGYTGGSDGTGYYLNGSREDTYVNQFAVQQQELGQRLAEGWSGSKEAEALWEDYRKQYLREGERAYRESLGQAAANTGGMASTAAVTAAQQARNYYAAQAADKKAELYQQAYDNWLAGRQSDRLALETYNGLHQSQAALWQQDYENRTAAQQQAYENARAEQIRAQELAQQAYENQTEAERWQQQMEAAERQQAYENAQTEKTQAQKLAQQDYENRTAAEQRAFDNAMAKWKAYGYVTEDTAAVLALPVGTAYTEQAYAEWDQAYQEAKSGLNTGKTQYDAVNLGQRETAAATDRAADHETLYYGANSVDVQTMQQYLMELGYSVGQSGADGKFGSGTMQALRAFQRSAGVYADGVCGPVTWTALIKAAGRAG